MSNRKSDPEAIERLRNWLKPGDTLYCVLRHVSRSGMQRTIALVWPEPDEYHEGKLRMMQATTNAAKALGWRYDEKRDGIVVDGCGMDMGFHLVYTLSHVLFPNGYPLKAEVYRGFCKRSPCTCHDDTAWTVKRNESGRIVEMTYPHNCDCGCKWHIPGRNGDESGWESDGGYALKSEWL